MLTLGIAIGSFLLATGIGFRTLFSLFLAAVKFKNKKQINRDDSIAKPRGYLDY